MIAPMAVDKAVLEEYCLKYPRSRIFLENFFLSSEDHPRFQTWLNWLLDLRLYRPTNKEIQANEEDFVRAFERIRPLQ